jgi:hypothetical protein
MLTTTLSTTEVPHRLICELNSFHGIRLNTIDPDPAVLMRAQRALSDTTLNAESLAHHMRKLFFHDFITDEIVETYNALEKRWKYLTNYRMTTFTPVLWQEK